MHFIFSCFGDTNVATQCYFFLDCAPTWTRQPSNPSFVHEENDLTLTWTFNLDGTLRSAQFQFLPATTIALKDVSGLTFGDGYTNRTLVVITESETNITLLAMDKSDSGNYRYLITNNGLASAGSDVEIIVQCKLELHFL